MSFAQVTDRNLSNFETLLLLLESGNVRTASIGRCSTQMRVSKFQNRLNYPVNIDTSVKQRACVAPQWRHVTASILTHGHVHYVEGEDVDGEQGEGRGEQVEVSIVPLAHTVPHPRTVVVEAI